MTLLPRARWRKAPPRRTRRRTRMSSAPSDCSRAWAEGQLRSRGYPGMVVGVVSDQRLVWAKGFGLANVAGKVPMTPQTKIQDGLSQQAVHGDRHHAVARAGEAPSGRSGVEAPAVVRRDVPTAGRSAHHHRGAADTQLRSAARGGGSLDDVRLPDARRAEGAHAEAAGRVSRRDSLEILEPRLHTGRARSSSR